MNNVMDYPLLVFALSFLLLWISARIGATLLMRQRKLGEDIREDLDLILAATLTLLGLIDRSRTGRPKRLPVTGDSCTKGRKTKG